MPEHDPTARRMVTCPDFVRSGKYVQCDHAGHAPGCKLETCTEDNIAMRPEPWQDTAERNARIARRVAAMTVCPFGCNPCDFLRDPDKCIAARLEAAEKEVGE